MRDVVILFVHLIVVILSRKILLACVAGNNLVVRRIPFLDVLDRAKTVEQKFRQPTTKIKMKKKTKSQTCQLTTL
jgi:hypothetical protein